jgi:hypothetical protein
MVANVVAAANFRIDVKGVEVRSALARAGIESVLIKGPVLKQLLYSDTELRSYEDVDLLVDPGDLAAAGRVLRYHDFVRFEPDSSVRQTDSWVASEIGPHGADHAVAWIRERDSFLVDLHDSLPQVGLPPAEVWRRLQEHLDTMEVAGAHTVTLDLPATALLIALHCAHHGPDWGSAIEDLRRAVAVFDGACWTAARDLARNLEAESGMGIGLGLVPEGRPLAAALSLSTEPTPEYRMLWAGEPWSASVLAALLRRRELRSWARIVTRLLLPSPEALRRGSALARRGFAGLIAAYVLRVFVLALHVHRAVIAHLRSRRQLRNSD